MEEADRSLIATLTTIGAPFGAITSLKALGVAPFINVVTFCINTISESTDFRTEFPAGLAARHQLGTRLGKRIKAMGYSGDAGYNQFLYPNDKFVRKIMLWLLEAMPKPEEEAADEVVDAAATLQAAIGKQLARWAKGRWRPACARTEASVVRRVHAVSLNVARTRGVAHALRGPTERYHATHLSAVSLQPADPRDAPASLLQNNARQLAEAHEKETVMAAREGSSAAHHHSIKDMIRAGIANSAYGSGGFSSGGAAGSNSLGDVLGALNKGRRGGGGGDASAFERAAEFAGEGADEVVGGAGGKKTVAMTAEEKAAEEKAEEERRAARIAKLKRKLEKTGGGVKAMQTRKDQLVVAARQLEAELSSRKAKSKGLENIALVKKKTLGMLPEAEMHKKRLNGLCQQTATQLLQLGAQWEKTRRPLVLTARRLKESSVRRQIDSASKVADMRRMREEMRGMAAQLRAKESKLLAMQAEYKKLPKGIDRSQYVERIMDIVGQCRRQQDGIDSVINDIRRVQKEINNSGGRLARAEAITDDKLYKMANVKRPEKAVVEVYRHFTSIRDLFNELRSLNEKIGRADKETREAQNKAQAMRARNIDANLAKIKEDIVQVQRENAGLGASK